MYNFSEVVLENIIVHNVGNKSKEEGVKVSNRVLLLEEAVQQVLMQYFLSPFKAEVFYNFSHGGGVEMNEVYQCAKKIFEEPGSFQETSIQLANRLYEKSNHAKIKSGEFYIVHFRDCFVDDEVVDAIGLFKSENKDTYLRVFEKGESFGIDCDTGININKLDKGCIVFNTEKENGYLTTIVDTTNKNSEAAYWKDEFLKVSARKDDFFYTQNMMEVCKDFVDVVAMDEEKPLAKKDQLLMKNRAVEYFADREVFDAQEFQEEVIQDPGLMETFKEHKTNFEEMHAIEPSDQFAISKPAFKEKKKIMKSVIKLDKAFHVYVHGAEDKIEKGYDEERGMNFYKLFFNEEA